MRQLQYQTLADPLLGLPQVPVLSWTPVCPAQTPRALPRAATLLLVACVLVPQHSAAEGSALDWTPRYPDAIHRAAVHACQVPFRELRPSITAQPPPADVPWFPLYPETVSGLRQPAWQLPQHVEPALVVISLSKKALLEWLPRFPDQSLRPELQTAAQLAFSGPPLASSDFKWLPRYPDQIPRPRVLTALQTACVTGEIRPQAPPLLVWDPIYPSWIARRTLPTALQPFLAFTFGPTNPIPYDPPHGGGGGGGGGLEHGKLKHQRSTVEVSERRPHLLPAASFDPVPLPNPPPAEGYPDGYITFPDQLLPQRRLATEAQQPFAFYVIPLLPDPQLAWQPAMPDQYRFRTPLPIDQREVMVGPLNDVTVLQPVVWLPTFPDRFAARVSAWTAPVIVEIGEVVEIATLGWGVEAPVWIARPSGWREAGAVLVIQPPAVGADALEVLIGNERVEASALTATTLVGD